MRIENTLTDWKHNCRITSDCSGGHKLHLIITYIHKNYVYNCKCEKLYDENSTVCHTYDIALSYENYEKYLKIFIDKLSECENDEGNCEIFILKISGKCCKFKADAEDVEGLITDILSADIFHLNLDSDCETRKIVKTEDGILLFDGII